MQERAVARFRRARPHDPDRPSLDPLAEAYLAAVLEGDRDTAVGLVTTAAERGRGIHELYEDVLAPAQREVGRLWQQDEITVATEHYCTAVAQLAVAQLHPYVFGGQRNGRRLVATTVQGNRHELGVRMVTDIFELEGWDTYYLGADMPHDAVVDAVAGTDAELLLVSATLADQVAAVGDLVARVRADERTVGVAVLVGGPPFTDRDAARRVGADAAGQDARDGLVAAARLLGDGA